MGTQARAPVGSRWQDTQGRVWKVIERKPFGRIDMMREDRAVFGLFSLQEVLTFTRLD